MLPSLKLGHPSTGLGHQRSWFSDPRTLNYTTDFPASQLAGGRSWDFSGGRERKRGPTGSVSLETLTSSFCSFLYLGTVDFIIDRSNSPLRANDSQQPLQSPEINVTDNQISQRT